MKLLLICAGGMSTSILVAKLKKHAAEIGIEEFECEAHSAMSFEDLHKKWDVTLYAPQVSNKAKFFKEVAGPDYPLGKIEPADYALGNAVNIFKEIDRLLTK